MTWQALFLKYILKIVYIESRKIEEKRLDVNANPLADLWATGT